MKTETAVLQFWGASLAWRGMAPTDEKVTVQNLFEILHPIVVHRSLPLARQATELSDMIVKFKHTRCAKPRRKLTNLVQFPSRIQQKTIAA